MSENPVALIIIWSSPIIAGGFLWLIIDKISKTDLRITEVHKTAKDTGEKVQEIEKSIVRIETNVEHLMEGEKREKKRSDNFENKVVTILRSAKGRFE